MVTSGILLVDKPAGMTSHDVVGRVRRLFGTRQVGHTGTLDPDATGLLVVLVGRAVKGEEKVFGGDCVVAGEEVEVDFVLRVALHHE